MKKYLIIGLLIAFFGAMVFRSCAPSSTDDSPTELPAAFAFEDNLATSWDEKVAIDIVVNNPDVETLELIYNDSTFARWTSPGKKITYQLKAGFYGLGARQVELVATLKDGSKSSDKRIIRVLSDVVPEIWIAEIKGEYPHDVTSFTQGLEFSNGQLYEGTGNRGESILAQVNLSSGKIMKSMGLDGNYFGEGITILNGKIYQITWQEQTCFVYNQSDLTLIKDLNYSGEGWGLCNDGSSLIMSDGSERITFRNPETFAITRTIEVYTHQGPVTKLNELEYVDGLIYANVWMTNKVAVIDPNNGKVVAELDATELVRQGRGNGDVLNGIAYNPATKKWYMTGKKWPKLFEVSFKKPNV